MDCVAHLQIPAIYASEEQAQKGHDIIVLSRFTQPHLYAKCLVNVDDVVQKIGSRVGAWTDTAIGRGPDGEYQAIPSPSLPG